MNRKTLWVSAVTLVVLLIAGGTIYALPKYQVRDFQNNINKVEAIRVQDLESSNNIIDQQNKIGENIEIILAEDKDYPTKSEALKKINGILLDAKQAETATILRAQQQVDTFQPNNITNLNGSYKIASTKVRDSLNMNKELINKLAEENRADYTAVNALSAVILDTGVVADTFNKNDIDSALSAAAPLQKYTRSSFSYTDEAAFASTYPQTTDTIDKAKSFFANYYNYLIAIKQNDKVAIAKIQPTIDTDYTTLNASFSNALEEKNPKFTTLYQENDKAIQEYYEGLKSVKGITVDGKREQVSYLLNAIELYNNKNDKYPQSTTLAGMKTIIETDYGSDDFFKYSSDKEKSYTVEYRTEASNSWKTLTMK